jgi:putative hemolysin
MFDVLTPIVVILLMVAANALYVAAEFATVGARKSRVQEAAEAGSAGARVLLAIVKDSSRLDTYVAACQIGITLSSLVAGAYGQARLTPLLTPVFGALGGEAAAVVVVLVFITVLQVVLGELLPKTIALRYPERLAVATLAPMRVSLVLFRPLIAVFNGTAFAVMRRFGLHVEGGHMHVHSPEELEGLYRDSAAGGLIDASERDMLAGVLNVEARLVREIMTPRTRLIWVDAAEPIATALPRLVETPYSRFPVATGSIDEVVGTVHLRALFAAADRGEVTTVGDVMRSPLVVADLMTVPKLWQTLRDAGRHSALVVDEYGTVAGMVTLEDALEEIFGEMQDEFDREDDPIVEAGGRVSLRGDVLVQMLNDRYDLALPEDEVDTVGGLMWHLLGRLPIEGDQAEWARDGIVLRVDAMDRNAVRRVSFARDGGAS